MAMNSKMIQRFSFLFFLAVISLGASQMAYAQILSCLAIFSAPARRRHWSASRSGSASTPKWEQQSVPATPCLPAEVAQA